MLTQQRLKEVLTYDRETGYFTSNYAMRGRSKGSICGGYDKDGYIQTRIDGHLYRAHRLVFLYVYGELPNGQIDHINHKRDDNRLSNLRLVSHQENRKNSVLNSNNKSGYLGVHYDKCRKKWKSEICIDGKNKYLGRFDCINDAISARERANKEYGFHKNHGLT